MNTFAAAGAGFLVAVLWFDLMFDVQLRAYRGKPVPAAVLRSISTYYRRVTTEASPMGSLVAGVMVFTLLPLAAEISTRAMPWWVGLPSLLAAIAAFVLTLTRTVPNAVQLGSAADAAPEQERLARAIWRDHRLSLAAMLLVLGLQLSASIAG
jgi:hypothetical protein